MDEIVFKPIGIINSPFKEPKGTPIQPAAARDIEGTVEVFPEYIEGLQDIEGFSHITLLFYFHLSAKPALKRKPFMEDKEHGIFAIRAPNRPNPIGISTVRLVDVERNILHIKDIDIVDGTPLLDIKPYVPEFDKYETVKIGWLENNIYKLPNAKNND